MAMAVKRTGEAIRTAFHMRALIRSMANSGVMGWGKG
jgi:hypothetical protein